MQILKKDFYIAMNTPDLFYQKEKEKKTLK